MFTDEQLIDVLRQSQQLGFLGARDVEEVIAHSDGFVTALDDVTGAVVDLGSGGGVPGLVIAQRRPDLRVVMVDRRTKRTDFLTRMARRVGRGEQIEVLALDTADLVTMVNDGVTEAFDAAVARGFGPPMTTLTTATALVRPGGVIIISEPPDGDRWDVAEVEQAGATPRSGRPGVAVFVRR